MNTGKLIALARLFTGTGPECAVSKRWLANTGSKLDKEFVKYLRPTIKEDGPYQIVTVEGTNYVWPRQSPLQGLYQILSELTNPNHPHQYIYGKTTIDANDVVLDIGACEGTFSAKSAEFGACPVIVEPSKFMCEMIKHLFKIRGLAEPTIYSCLIGQKSGKAYFIEDEQNPGASRVSDTQEPNSYLVEVKTLDQLAAEINAKITFVKCDAEGFDVGILKSGREFLKANRPKIAVTTYHNDSDFFELYQFLTQIGYQVEGKGFLFSGQKLRVQMIHAK